MIVKPVYIPAHNLIVPVQTTPEQNTMLVFAFWLYVIGILLLWVGLQEQKYKRMKEEYNENNS